MLNKVLFTFLLIFVVWRAAKMIGPLLARVQGEPPPAPRPGRSQARRQPARPATAVDLVACPHCGTFVPRGPVCPSRAACRLQHG